MPPGDEPEDVAAPFDLAEIRARRGEGGSALRRAEAAERAATNLERRLRTVQDELAAVGRERDVLREALAARERDLRGARQREEAERRVRQETEDDAAAVRARAEAETEALRSRLAATQERTSELHGEVERLRRTAHEAQVAAVTAQQAAPDAGPELEAARAAVAGERRRATEAIEEERARAAAAIERWRDELARARTGLAAAGQELQAFAGRLAEVEDERDAWQAERALLQSRTEELVEDVEGLRARFEETTGRLSAELARERERREAAEAERDRLAGEVRSLQDELDRRPSAESDVLAELERLRGEQEQVAAALAAFPDDLVHELGRVETRVAALARELDEQRRARETAEQIVAALQGEVERLREGAPAGRPDAAVLQELRAAFDGVRTAPAGAPPAAEPAPDFDAVARRLRAAAQAPVAPAEASVAEPEPYAPPFEYPLPPPAEEVGTGPGVEPEIGLEPEPEPVADTSATAAPAAEASAVEAPAVEPRIESELVPASTPTAAAAGAVALGPRTARLGERPGPWLRRGLQVLGRLDGALAAELLLELLPVQALRARKALVYDLRPDGAAPVRVRLEHGTASVRELRDGGPAGEQEADVAGPIEALAPLAAGGAGRGLPGAAITGRRRRVRRLLRDLRAPVSLAEVARAGCRPDPGRLLTLLALLVEPAWLEDVDLHVVVEAGRPLTVATRDGRLRVAEGAEPEAQATLRVAPEALPALLGNVLPAGAATATVEGDHAAAELLLDLLDRAQG
jgi:predicted  nucleic acid-binding Zn-ribbon protein